MMGFEKTTISAGFFAAFMGFAAFAGESAVAIKNGVLSSNLDIEVAL